MTEKILVLEPGDERAQKIAKAMASQTASDILQLLGDGQTSLTDIAERLNLPMNTAKYHVENLLEAGLISVAETRYSVKGREVKMYTLANQLLVVAPRQSSMRSLILKYATLFGIVALSSALIAALSPVIKPSLGSPQVYGGAGPQLAVMHDGSTGSYATRAVMESAASPNATPAGAEVMTKGAQAANDLGWAANASPAPGPMAMQQMPPQAPAEITTAAAQAGIDPAIAFFLGGVLVIFILLCYEAWLWKRK
jgi:DNA-binding transcriptional ArsR family regulator